MSSALLRLQQHFQRSILKGASALENIVGASSSEREERFGIYALAYRLRLREALAHNFPMFQVYVGESDFAAIADRYNDAHPSTFASIRGVGAQLASWLADHRRSEPWLAEFARLEWSLGAAFDAADESKLSSDALAAIQPGDWSRLRFRIATHVRRLSFSSNAPELYGCVSREEPSCPGRVADGASEWLVWRESLSARYRPMNAAESLAFDSIARGRTFGDMCESLLQQCSEDEVAMQAAACLNRWIADELLVTLSIADD